MNAGSPLITLLDLNKVTCADSCQRARSAASRLGNPRAFIWIQRRQPIDAFVSRIDPQATFTPENTYFRDDRVKQVVGVKLR